jgi:hypothetical protein
MDRIEKEDSSLLFKQERYSALFYTPLYVLFAQVAQSAGTDCKKGDYKIPCVSFLW